MILSICIPSFNRPVTLQRLLNSIDILCGNDIEVVICEDCSIKRAETRKIVQEFKDNNCFRIRYIENPVNYGFDKNLRELIKLAKGDFIMFIGDDDYLIKESLAGFLTFLKSNIDKGYILKNWVNLHENGWNEPFNYYKNTKFFAPGSKTIIELFRLSTFISGFTFNRKLSLPFLIDKFDGTLLFQLYLLGELALRYPSAYYESPLIVQTEEKVDVPHFGSSSSEKGLYTPGKITIENSINFLKGYFRISSYLDSRYMINVSNGIKKDMSKHSFSYFYLHRDKSLREYRNFYKALKKEVGLDTTIYFHIYYYMLLILGKRNSKMMIHAVKRIVKQTL